MAVNRKCSLGEVVVYVAAWAIFCVCISVDRGTAFTQICIWLLPAVLIGGPVGMLIGGRGWFLPSALIGFVLWCAILIVPAMQAVR